MSWLRTILYFFSEGTLALWRHRALHGFALFIVTLSLFVLGFSRYLTGNVNALVQSWQDDLEVRVFFDDALPQDQILAIQRKLEKVPCVASARLVTPEEALKILARFAPAFAQASSELGENPLPPSLSLRLKSPLDLAAVRRMVAEAGKLPGVSQVLFDWQWVEKIRTYSRFVSLLGWILFGALSVAAVFTVAAITRIMVLSRREEIAILHFVGATAARIRGPFVASGMILGFLAGLLALLLLAVTHVLLHRVAGPDALLLTWVSKSFLPLTDQAALLLMGTFLGGAGGGVSLGGPEHWI